MATQSPPASDPKRPIAADLMTSGPRTCSPFSTVTEAALLLREEPCGAVPVTEAGKPVGMITDHDVAQAMGTDPNLPARPVREIMSTHITSVPPDAPIEVLQQRLRESKDRCVLVVDPQGDLQGVVPWTDVIGYPPAYRTAPAADGSAGDTRHPATGREQTTKRWWAHPKAFWSLLKATAHDWSLDKVPRLGAALAFYAVLSLAPLLLIAIAVAGFVFGEEAARGQLVGQIQGLVGKEGARAIQDMIASAHKPRAGSVATIIGILTLLAGASGVFGQLQDAMNTIWEVRPRPDRGWPLRLKDRFFSFAMVLGTGFLLLVSLVLSAAIQGALKWLGGLLPVLAPVLGLTDTVVSFIVITLLFAMIFKVLPDVEISWKDVWVGAVITGVLFLIGKELIGLYLGRSSYATTYGAGGSLVVLLIWIYYSAQILFFGAEFTKVYADRFGSRIEPSPGAEPVTLGARAEQGIVEPGASAHAPA